MVDDPLRAWVAQVSRRHGFSPGSDSSGNDSSGSGLGSGEAQTIDFDEDEGTEVTVPVHSGDPGIQAEQQIVNLLQEFVDAIQNYWSNYGDGLHNFSEAMQFESDQAAEPQHLKAVFKELAKEAFDDAIDEVASRAGPWGMVVSASKTAITAWVAESERAATAAGGVLVRDYIASIRNGIAGQRDRMIAAARAQQRPLIQEFQRLARGDVGQGTPTSDGRVVGEAATVLNQLVAGVAAFQRSMPSSPRFQQMFTRNFANTPGWSGPISHGARLSGTLHFAMRLHVEPGDPDAWEIKEKDRQWNLVTRSPEPDRIASSLAASLDGKKPWEIDLPKMVQLRVEVEGNGTRDGSIYFTGNPGSFEVRSHHEERWFREAWGVSLVRQAALNTTRLTGSND